jgi:hypothetical protein
VTVHSEHIGNTFGLKGFFDRLQPARLVVEIAQIVVHEGHEPKVVAHLRDADVLSRNDVTEIDLASVKEDLAAVRRNKRRVVIRVGELAAFVEATF